MGVLHVIDRVFAVSAHREVHIEIQMGIRLGVEEEPRRVPGYFVKQVRKGYGLSRALGDLDDLAVAHESYQLHQQEVQPVGVDAQRGQGFMEAQGVTVVIRAPYVDDLVEASFDEFVAVIRHVHRVIRIKTV